MKFRLNFLIICVFSFLVITSCEYKYNEPEVALDPNIPISFSGEIVPIFTTEKCTDCHKAGGLAESYVVLTSAEAYQSIMSKGLVDTANGESSLLYVEPSVGGNHSSRKEYTSSESAKVLLWIKQGAKNN